MNEGKLLAEEVARRAKELYEREIGSNLEAGCAGCYLIVDTNRRL